MPPCVWTVLVFQPSGSVAGGVVDEGPDGDEVAVVWALSVVDVDVPTVVGTVGSGRVVVVWSVVVVCWAIDGAATFSGATGGSLTWAAAALTICQVSAVAVPSTTSQTTTRLQRFTSSLLQSRSETIVKGESRFP